MDSSDSDFTEFEQPSVAAIVSIWSRLKELLACFETVETTHYVSRCMSLAERLAAKTEPIVIAEELVLAIQSELPIPVTPSQLPTTGVLGLCVNLATILRHDEEDPIECIVRTFSDS